MKTTVQLTIVLITIISCNVDPSPTYRPSASVYSSGEMAKKVITALQHASSEEYVTLFPTLQEFHTVMEKNSAFYDESLSAAKQEFANTYQNHLIKNVKDSFDRIIREGNKKGIAWNTIYFERFESPDITGQQFEQSEIFIVFIANGKTYTLALKRTLVLNGQWKVSQFIELI